MEKLTILLRMAMCAMIETYDYPVTFLCYFIFHTVFQYGYL